MDCTFPPLFRETSRHELPDFDNSLTLFPFHLSLFIFFHIFLKTNKTCNFFPRFYGTPNVLLPFGNDFAFTDAPTDFADMEQLLAIINANASSFGLASVRFSTLSELACKSRN
jgi:hypothetical protein